MFAFYPFFIVVFGLGDLPQVMIAFMLGVVTYITPFPTIGFTCIVERWLASRVWYSQAGWSLWTLAACICASGEYWVPFASPR